MMRQLLLTLTVIEFSECPGMMGSTDVSLVGGATAIFKNMKVNEWMGRIIPYIMENKKCMKPPTSSKMRQESNGEIFGGTICFGIPLFMFNGLCHGAIFWKCEAENPVNFSWLPQNPKVCHLWSFSKSNCYIGTRPTLCVHINIYIYVNIIFLWNHNEFRTLVGLRGASPPFLLSVRVKNKDLYVPAIPPWYPNQNHPYSIVSPKYPRFPWHSP